ncbi:hypothetical protein EV715DRAFT_289330 [Schizophyllum commune]
MYTGEASLQVELRGGDRSSREESTQRAAHQGSGTARPRGAMLPPRALLVALSVLACPQAARADIFEDEDGEWHIGTGAVAGIIVGAVFFVILFVGGIIYRQRRARRAAGGLPFTGQPPYASQVPAPSPLYTPRADGGLGGHPYPQSFGAQQSPAFGATPMFGAPPMYENGAYGGYGPDKSGAFVSDAGVPGSAYPPAAHLADK